MLVVRALTEQTQANADDPWRAVEFAGAALVASLMFLLKRHVDSIKTRTREDIKEVHREVSDASKVAVKADAKSQAVSETFGQVLEFAAANRAQTQALSDAIDASNKQATSYQNTIAYLTNQLDDLRTVFDGRIKLVERLLAEEKTAREKADKRNDALEKRCDDMAAKYEADHAAWNAWADKVLLAFASIPGSETVVEQIPPRPNGDPAKPVRGKFGRSKGGK